MKFKKMLATGAAICAIVAPMYTMASSNTQQVHITGKVEKDLFAHFDKGQVPASAMVTLEKIAAGDKNFKLYENNDGSIDIIKVYPALQGMVYVNGTAVQVSKDGTYSTDVAPGQVKVETKNKGVTHSARTVNVDTSNSAVDLIDSFSFSDFFGSMDAMNSKMSSNNQSGSMEGMPGMSSSTTSTTSTGTVQPNSIPAPDGGAPYPGQNNGDYLTVGEHVHCNRMNGPNSDDRYWTQGTYQAIIDFNGSDCDDSSNFYGCVEPNDTACDGLGVSGMLYDCSNVQNWPITFWRRN